MEDSVGAQIRAFRESLNLSARELAERVALDATVISKIENGHRQVKSAELARIASALRVSPLALLQPQSLLARLPVAARQAGSTFTDGAAYQRLLGLAELSVVLADGGLPTSPLLHSVPEVRDRPWLEGATELATWATTNLGTDLGVGDQRFSRIVDVIEEKLRVDIIVEPFAEDSLSGATITSRDFPLIFVNSRFPVARCLFTLAHELGHLLAGDAAGLTLDRELSGGTDEERAANAFAAVFLMPEDRIREVIESNGRTASTLANLTYEFGVSYESLVYRLHNLGLINASGRDALREVGWEAIRSRLGDPRFTSLSREAVGRLQTRGNQHPATRLPALLTKRAFDGYLKGIISVRPLAGLLGEDPEELLNEVPMVDEWNEVLRVLNAEEYLDGDGHPSESPYVGRPV